MENSGLQTLLCTSEETEEPWPKKIKIDMSHVSSEDEQQQLLQSLYYADKKSANKSLHFPEVLWNFSQNGLELQEEISAHLNNVRQFAHFKQRMNINLESRFLGNILFYEKVTHESNNSSIIREASSEFNENNPLVTTSEAWAFHAKERNEVFSSEEGVTDGENSNGKTSHLCLLASGLMKGMKSELGSLFYDNKNVVERDGDILTCKKRTRFPANNYPRRNKVSEHPYGPFSRICSIRTPKLVRCAAFELLLQDKILHNSGIASKENDTSVFSQGILFNTQQRRVSKESRIKECRVFSKNTVEAYIDSVSGNDKEQMSEQFVFSSNQISPKNNVPNSTLWGKQLCNPKKMQDLTANFKLLNYLSSSKKVEKLSFKYSSLQMEVTVGTRMQEKKIKTFSKNIVCPAKKQQTSHFLLRASKKHRIRTCRNDINLASKNKYVLKYLRTCGRAAINKNKYGNSEDFQENTCVFIDREACFSSFDTYKKIYLSTDSEEVYLISFLKNVILNDKNNEKCSKGCIVADTRITCSVLDTLIYSCDTPILLTNVNNCNSVLVQEKKNKKPQYLEDININSQWSKYEINNIPFPINGLSSENILKHFSDDDQYFTLTISHLYKDQTTTVDVKAGHSKIALPGNRGKQSGFIFGNIKSVLQSQPVHHFRVSKCLKHPKIKKVDENCLLQKRIMLSSMQGSKLESVKQNTEDVKIENEVVEQTYTCKSHQHQNVIVPYYKDESAKYIGSKDNLMVVSHTLKEHFEHTIEKYPSTEVQDQYEFEMKNQFDLVLEELCMFNEINKKNGTRQLCGKVNILEEDPLEQNHSDSVLGEDPRNEIKENMTFSTCSTTLEYTISVMQNESRQHLFNDAVLKQTGKQELLHDYCSSDISDEELFCSPAEEHCDSGCKQLYPWKPAFVCHTFMKKQRYSFQNERGNCLFDGVIRVQPLKTCRGPLRIGLSKKAKLRQLHPYLK